ncbi:MAG: alkaline phosphatase family protein [Gammaproteobacteria bacterium]|nr:alkaline phosphatase family protein [Gammaproteobacteria bacterium]
MTDPGSKSRLLMIGLDAAEISLIDRWTRDGSLPYLKRLCERGAFARLDSTADWLVGSPWPTFYTGTLPSDHGLYHYLLWKPDIMTTTRPTPDWLPLDPFWRHLDKQDKRVIAIDMPLCYAPQAYEGVEISGWATHELLVPPDYYPPSIKDWIEQHHGTPQRDEEEYRLMTPQELLAIRDQLISMTSKVAELGCGLMQREAWDLMMIVFSATHRGGHKLWDLSGMAGEATQEQRAALESALRDIYSACDRAIGRLLETAGDDVTVFVYSLHGMGENTCRSELLPEMLAVILADTEHRPPQSLTKRVADRLRAMVPLMLRNTIKAHLPMAVQDKLTTYWRTGGIDWSTTPAFALVSDLQGYIRINLRGREAEGIVASAEDYERLCTRISEGLLSFVDADSGEPIVHDVVRSSEIYPQGKRRDDLPDLVVKWAHTPAAAHRAIRSDRYHVSLPWPTPGHHPSGRSGNHRPHGFLVATGPGIAPGTILEKAHILDLIPTVLDILGLAATPVQKGRALFSEKSGDLPKGE